jgi:hypothetical protein
MIRRRWYPTVLLVLLASACFHQVVQTGRSPGSTVVDKPWQHSFVFGLVPPAEMTAQPTCTLGVAKVETERSFVNGLVGALTWNLYTPIHVLVTCASGPVAR